MPRIHNILLVEDNEDDVFLMKRALKRAGVFNPLHVVNDGCKTIEYLDGAGKFSHRREHPYPDLMFLDLMLPHRSGFDVLEWLNGRPDLPRPVVVVLSSSNSPLDMERVTQLGAALYKVKPPDTGLFDQITESFQIRWEPGR